MATNRTALYRACSADGTLLYVGISKSALQRIGQHAQDKPWWQDVEDVAVEWFDSRREAELAERAAIKEERPLHNIAHNRQRNPSRAEGNHELKWICETCGKALRDHLGFIHRESAIDGTWHAHCKACDPYGDNVAYWIGVERIRTETQLTMWEQHLQHKTWMDWIPWSVMLRRSLCRSS